MNLNFLKNLLKEIDNLSFSVSVGRFSVGRSGVYSKNDRPTADRKADFVQFWSSFLRSKAGFVSRSVGRFTVIYLRPTDLYARPPTVGGV